ncbi:MAG: transporter [Acidobacteriia bacterium]|nr:transporter [Terriglobia bacterium]
MAPSRRRTSSAAPWVAAVVMASQVHAGASTESPIQDNSFLVEEAYNQEPGVIQHISSYARSHGDGSWVYTFTEEWPAGGQVHQISATLPVLGVSTDARRRHGLGDVALNYRYQAVGDGAARVAVAPRLSLILPTGDEAQALGSGSRGLQVAVPASIVVARRFVTHWNLGGTWLPNARSPSGDEARATAVNAGASVVWLARPRLNVLLETVWARAEFVTGPGRTAIASSAFVNPGLRWAFDTAAGLQIVPGVAVPLGVGPSSGERQVFLYLSFEHPLKRR